MANGSAKQDAPGPEGDVARLQQALNDASRRNDREGALLELQSMKSIPLECIPFILEADADGGTESSAENKSSLVDLQSAEAETMTKRIKMNSVTFYATSSPPNNASNTENRPSSPFLDGLSNLCETLCATSTSGSGGAGIGSISEDHAASSTLDSHTLYESIVKRISQKHTAADSYFKLNSIMGSAELLLMAIKGSSFSDTSSKVVPACPIEIDLYVEGGNIHANIDTTECYGLFRKADVKTFNPASPRAAHNKPWIIIAATIHEMVSFSNGESVRSLKTKVVQNIMDTGTSSRRMLV